MANIPGQMVEHMLVIGTKTSFTTKEFTPGLMEEFMKESITWIRNMDSVFIGGQMENVMQDSGVKVSSMAKVNLLMLMVKAELVSGRMESESNGYPRMLLTSVPPYNHLIWVLHQL